MPVPYSRPCCGLLLALVVMFLTAAPSPAQIQDDAPGEAVVVVPIKGELSRSQLHLIRRGVRQALALRAKTIVYEVDSPGGEVTLMEEIDDAMHQADEDGIETVALVINQANSAAAFLAIGCDWLFMTPASQIGSARPIRIGPTGIIPTTPGLGDPETEKFLSAFRASFRRQAEAQGRNVSIAEAMVDDRIELVLVEKDGEPEVIRRVDYESLPDTSSVQLVEVVCQPDQLLNLTANEALRFRFIDGIVASRVDLASRLDASPSAFLELGPTWSEDLADFLDHIGLVLFFLGCLFLFIEFKIPGFGVPGILGVGCLALLLFGKYLAGLAEVPEILLVVLGLGLVAIELFVIPGTMVTGIIGGLAVIVGLFLSFQSFVIPREQWQFQVMGYNALTFSGAFVGALLGLFIVARYLPHAPLLNRLVLDRDRTGGPDLHGGAAAVDDVVRWAEVHPGAEGVAVSTLRPAGRILVGSQQLDAVTEGMYIDGGSRIRVIRVEGNRIVVRAVRPS